MYKPQLDGLRALAFVGVFFAHCLHDTVWWGGFGVQVFFVLSGFLITRILIAADTVPLGRRLGMFFMRRALRIFPAYFALLGVLAALGHSRFFGWQATYTYNIRLWYLSSHDRYGEILHHWHLEGLHLWSMSIEEQFYLLYPFLLAIVRPTRRVACTVTLIAASIVARLVLDDHDSTSYYGALLPVCGEYVLWGALLAFLHERKSRLARFSPLLATAIGAAAFAAIATVAKPSRGHPAIFAQFIPVPNDAPWGLWVQTGYAVAFTLFVHGLLDDRNPVSRLFAVRPIAFMGKISYGLYCFHLPLWALAQPDGLFISVWPALAEPENAWIVYGLLFFSSLVVASASWFLLEQPINRLKRRFSL